MNVAWLRAPPFVLNAAGDPQLTLGGTLELELKLVLILVITCQRNVITAIVIVVIVVTLFVGALASAPCFIYCFHFSSVAVAVAVAAAPSAAAACLLCSHCSCPACCTACRMDHNVMWKQCNAAPVWVVSLLAELSAWMLLLPYLLHCLQSWAVMKAMQNCSCSCPAWRTDCRIELLKRGTTTNTTERTQCNGKAVQCCSLTAHCTACRIKLL